MKGEKMALSRKHYKRIATIIKDSTLKDNTMVLPIINKVSLINRLSSMFKEDNILFDKDKFLDAC